MPTTQTARTLTMRLGRKVHKIESFAHASRLYCAERDRRGVGASRMHAAPITDPDGSTVAYVSYNGRVWQGEPREWTPDTTMLYESR